MIIQPLISEKSTQAMERDCFVFLVTDDSTKNELKKEIETLFKVKVINVKTANLPGKAKVFRRIKGVRNRRLKAYVRLAKGQVIPGFEKEQPKKEKAAKTVKSAETTKESDA